jgi:hypothetical protein
MVITLPAPHSLDMHAIVVILCKSVLCVALLSVYIDTVICQYQYRDGVLHMATCYLGGGGEGNSRQGIEEGQAGQVEDRGQRAPYPLGR